MSVSQGVKIARDWNTQDPNSSNVGYVTRLRIREKSLDGCEVHQVSGRECREYRIPASDCDAFNDDIVGTVDVIYEFQPDSPRKQ